MTFEIDPAVQEKISHRSDRHRLEEGLSSYSPAAQKRWVANPLVEYIIQSYINQLTTGMTAAPAGRSAKTETSPEAKKDVKSDKKDDKKDDGSDSDGGGMFDLFD